MATLRLVLDTRWKQRDGRFPVIIRVTHNSKSTSLATGVRIYLNQWNDKRLIVTTSHPEHKSLNHLLRTQLLAFEKIVLDPSLVTPNHTIKQVKDLLCKPDTDPVMLFKDYGNSEVNRMKLMGRDGNAEVYKTALNQLLKFAGESLRLDQITYSLIVDFETHLRNKGLKKNSIAVYMRELRAIINQAIKRGLYDKNRYPFSSYAIKGEKTISRAIPLHELKSILNYNLSESSKAYQARELFLLQFYLIGISFADLISLKQENLKSGRIVYQRKKTGKLYSIKLLPEASSIINRYHDTGASILLSKIVGTVSGGVMPKRSIDMLLKAHNKQLKRIGISCRTSVKLTSYVSRYTWSNIAKSLGYSKDMIAEALGHEYGNQVTGIYLESYGIEEIDKMNERVASAIEI